MFLQVKVTIVAEEDCQVLVFDGYHLDRVYEVCPKLNLILDCLVGKDINQKLYSTCDLANSIMNEKNGAAQRNRGLSIAGPNFGKGKFCNILKLCNVLLFHVKHCVP